VNKIRANLLCDNPDLPIEVIRTVRHDFQRFATLGLPAAIEQYLLDAYRLDVSTTYAGVSIKNPWGKASGQLSMTEQQVAEDASAGLGFCVLKSVIAVDAGGGQSMRAWAVPEARMVLERIRASTGAEGWTVGWKGRGWSRSFQEYLEFVRAARRVSHASGMLIVPSCKYHLPTSNEPEWKNSEYEYTTRMLVDAYFSEQPHSALAMPIEKDFSPTLAGSELASEQSQILHWLRTVPGLIRMNCGDRPLRVGLKLFNALFDDEFQLEMVRTVAAAGVARPDFIVYANRLFDPHRELDGHRGIAVGGPDLSQRNLRVLSQFQRLRPSEKDALKPLEISATGDISSGKMAVEYLLRGCCNFQLHTYFQLPASEYAMSHGTKTAKALHRLYFDPDSGFVPWLLHVANRLGIPQSSTIRLTDLVNAGCQYEQSTDRSHVADSKPLP
jgi:hypothetical protein